MLPQCLPRLLITAHNDVERQQAHQAALQLHPFAETVTILDEQGRNETAVNALSLHRQYWPDMSEQERKTRILLLSRRGGGGKPQFIAPFVGGAVRPVARGLRWSLTNVGKQRGLRGHAPRGGARSDPYSRLPARQLRAGRLPRRVQLLLLARVTGYGHQEYLVESGRCYSRTRYATAGKRRQLGRTRGSVEEDPWFVDEHGNGSLVQTIIDLSTERGIVAFFLTKGVYERYLQSDGRLALFAISLNAPAISAVFEPGGASPEERLKGLAWAIHDGAMDQTIRLGPIVPIEGYKRHYHELFEMMADILGPRLKRITVDILRFSPQMPGILRASFPEEIVSSLLTQMEPAVKSHKYRPSAHRQQRLYHWVRTMLAHYSMSHVKTTPCKADPTEAFLFLRAGDIASTPCACHISYQDRSRIQRKAPPLLPNG